MDCAMRLPLSQSASIASAGAQVDLSAWHPIRWICSCCTVGDERPHRERCAACALHPKEQSVHVLQVVGQASAPLPEVCATYEDGSHCCSATMEVRHPFPSPV